MCLRHGGGYIYIYIYTRSTCVPRLIQVRTGSGLGGGLGGLRGGLEEVWETKVGVLHESGEHRIKKQ